MVARSSVRLTIGLNRSCPDFRRASGECPLIWALAENPPQFIMPAISASAAGLRYARYAPGASTLSGRCRIAASRRARATEAPTRAGCQPASATVAFTALSPAV